MKNNFSLSLAATRKGEGPSISHFTLLLQGWDRSSAPPQSFADMRSVRSLVPHTAWVCLFAAGSHTLLILLWLDYQSTACFYQTKEKDSTSQPHQHTGRGIQHPALSGESGGRAAFCSVPLKPCGSMWFTVGIWLEKGRHKQKSSLLLDHLFQVLWTDSFLEVFCLCLLVVSVGSSVAPCPGHMGVTRKLKEFKFMLLLKFSPSSFFHISAYSYPHLMC